MAQPSSPAKTVTPPCDRLNSSVQAVVIGDFGRKATLRFWAHLSALEYRRIKEKLPPRAPFYDEYRRISYCLLGDLPFVKKAGLAKYDALPLDDRILVGFPNGLTMEEILSNLGLLIFQALWGPVQRGVRDVWVLIPCNTLFPACRALEKAFGSPRRMLEMVAAAGTSIGPGEVMLAERIAERLHLRFPTVPEAVADFVRASGKSALMPLGTLGIMETYAEAIRRSGSPLQLVAPDRRQQAMVLEAIKAALCDDMEQQQAAERKLSAIASQVARQYGPQMAIVQACTDLSFDFALDSNAIFAETVVASVYGS